MIYDYPTSFSSWDLAEHEAIVRVRLSQRYTMGPEVEAFEAEYAAYHGRRHCVMVNSGSSANLVAVAALCHLRGGLVDTRLKVVVPAIAWSTTYAPLIQHGFLDLRIADVDDTWNAPFAGTAPDEQLYVVASILGNPAYLPSWTNAAKIAGKLVLNDDCESLGARIDGRTTASYGDIATSSFFWSHQLSAIEGGAVLTDDDALARLCRLLRNHGNAGFLNPDPDAGFDESYDFQLFGYNLRPLEMHAAVARAQLEKLDGFIERRQENAAFFAYRLEQERLRDKVTLPNLRFSPGFDTSPFGLHFTVESKDVRTKLVGKLRFEGIDCRLPTGGSFRRHRYGQPWADQPTPNADRIHDTGLFLGNAPWPIEDKIEKAVKIMRSVL